MSALAGASVGPMQATSLDPGLLTLVPPWIAYVVALVAVLVASRRVGTGLAVALTALTVPWALLAPDGATVVVNMLGFEQTLFRVDALTRPVTALFGFVAAANVLYGYATGADRRQAALALAYMGSGVAAVLAGDWLTLLIAWELLAVTATVLVWHHGGRAVRAGFRYAVYHLVGGTFLVAGIALHYAAAGTFAYGAGFTAGLPLALAIAGVGLNLGMIGVHAWLPDAYPAPHVAASVVLAAFTTKVAVYVLARLAPDGATAVVWLGALMVLYGVSQAILQTDTRRLLSYHIVSQVGYMVVAVGLGTAAGTAGAFAHLTAHVLYKGLLFMVAGAIIVRTGEASLKRLGGLGREMPLVFGTFLVAALAITGAPGFSGFVSKGLIAKATESAGPELVWWALVAGSVGTAISFAKFGYYAFVRPAPEELTVRSAPAPRALAAVMIVVAVPSIVFGLLPAPFLAAHPGDPGSFAPYASSELLKAGGALGAGLLAFALLRGPLGRVPALDIDRVLHPLGATIVGSAATGVGAALGTRLGALVGADPPPEATLRTALTALAATAALALLVALVG